LRGPDLVLLPPDLGIVKKKLAAGEPIGALIAITKSFMCPIDGFVNFEEGTFSGLHAITIVGFGLSPDAEEYYLVCNSWGESWGNEGHAWLPSAYLAYHATCIYGAT